MSTLKIATYNIWGFNEPWQYTVKRGIVRGAVSGSMATTSRLPSIWSRRCGLIVQALRRAQPDVIGLQEVCEFPDQPGHHQAEQIGLDLGYHCTFVPLVTDESEQERFVQGLAVLSRYEMRETHVINLHAVGMALHAIIATLPVALHLVVCHLAAHSSEAQHVAVEHILNYLATLPVDQPQIVVGDFNAIPESQTIEQMITLPAGLCDTWRKAHPADDGPTMPSESPTHRLDYSCIGNSFQVLTAERIGTLPDPDGFYPSDHLGVAATLYSPS